MTWGSNILTLQDSQWNTSDAAGLLSDLFLYGQQSHSAGDYREWTAMRHEGQRASQMPCLNRKEQSSATLWMQNRLPRSDQTGTEWLSSNSLGMGLTDYNIPFDANSEHTQLAPTKSSSYIRTYNDSLLDSSLDSDGFVAWSSSAGTASTEPYGQCGMTAIRSGNIDLQPRERLYRCHEAGCEAEFTALRYLDGHKSTTHGTLQAFQCPHPRCEYFEKRFNRKDTFERHIRRKNRT